MVRRRDPYDISVLRLQVHIIHCGGPARVERTGEPGDATGILDLKQAGFLGFKLDRQRVGVRRIRNYRKDNRVPVVPLTVVTYNNYRSGAIICQDYSRQQQNN